METGSTEVDTSCRSLRSGDNSLFDCNICLETVSNPVVTLCGHMYCWTCLYQWMRSHSECPVCKAGISEENVIPVYGHGATSVDSRSTAQMDADGVPERPRGQRLDASQMRRRYQSPNNERDQETNLFSGTFNWSMPFQPTFIQTVLGTETGQPLQSRQREVRQQEERQELISRLLLLLGSIVILSFIFY